MSTTQPTSPSLLPLDDLQKLLGAIDAELADAKSRYAHSPTAAKLSTVDDLERKRRGVAIRIEVAESVAADVAAAEREQRRIEADASRERATVAASQIMPPGVLARLGQIAIELHEIDLATAERIHKANQASEDAFEAARIAGATADDIAKLRRSAQRRIDVAANFHGTVQRANATALIERFGRAIRGEYYGSQLIEAEW